MSRLRRLLRALAYGDPAQVGPEEWHPVVGKEIVGFRIWRLERRHGVLVLTGIWMQAHWPLRRPMRAICYGTGWAVRSRYPPGGMGHDAPDRTHICGIHAARVRKNVIQRWHKTAGEGTLVVGSVSLWGKVRRHEDGFRAQFAYPRKLTIVPSAEDEQYAAEWAVELEQNYGVPVRVHGL